MLPCLTNQLLIHQITLWIKASISIPNLYQKFWHMDCNKCNKGTATVFEQSFTCIYCKDHDTTTTPRL